MSAPDHGPAAPVSAPVGSPVAPVGGGGIEARFAGRLGRFSLDVAFTAPTRGITGLFGPSGCGKTTVLRCIAGLARVPGWLRVDGTPWQDERRFVPPHRRPVGYVFQEASLFAHLSVRDNLRFGLRRIGRRAAAIGFDEAVDLLGLARLLERATAALSGGERQRVALGRALLSQPRLLLMDEPLSALDRASRDEILPCLERLHDTLAIPVVYVSHDISEVERLADHLVLLDDGRVRASGPMIALATDPALPLFRSPGAGVTLQAVIVGYDAAYDLTTFAVPRGRFAVPGRAGRPGQHRRLRINASDVSIATRRTEDSTILNILPARLLAAETVAPSQMNALLRLTGTRRDGADGSPRDGGPDTRRDGGPDTRRDGGQDSGQDSGQGALMMARVTRRSWDALDLATGRDVFVQVKSVALAD